MPQAKLAKPPQQDKPAITSHPFVWFLFTASVGGMLGNPNILPVLTLLLASLIWGAVLLRHYKGVSVRLLISGTSLLFLVILGVALKINSIINAPAIRKTVVVSVLNSGDWEGVATGERVPLKNRWLSPLPILRSTFVKDKPYPLELAISHAGRQASLWGRFTLRFKDTVAIYFPTDQREWRQQKSKKKGCLEYETGFSQIHHGDSPRKLWPVTSFIFLKPGSYEFEYEIDATAQDYNGRVFDGGVHNGKFLVELHE